jgi:hypothetical protein
MAENEAVILGEKKQLQAELEAARAGTAATAPSAPFSHGVVALPVLPALAEREAEIKRGLEREKLQSYRITEQIEALEQQAEVRCCLRCSPAPAPRCNLPPSPLASSAARRNGRVPRRRGRRSWSAPASRRRPRSSRHAQVGLRWRADERAARLTRRGRGLGADWGERLDQCRAALKVAQDSLAHLREELASQAVRAPGEDAGGGEPGLTLPVPPARAHVQAELEHRTAALNSAESEAQAKDVCWHCCALLEHRANGGCQPPFDRRRLRRCGQRSAASKVWAFAAPWCACARLSNRGVAERQEDSSLEKDIEAKKRQQ